MPELRSRVVTKVEIMLWKLEKAYYVPNPFVQHMLLSHRCDIDKRLGYFFPEKNMYIYRCSAVTEMPLNFWYERYSVGGKVSIINVCGIGNLGHTFF